MTMHRMTMAQGSDDDTGACICPPETFILLKQDDHSLQKHYHASYDDGTGV